MATLIVHGGAGETLDELRDGQRQGCETAAAAGWKLLEAGRAALDAVEAAVRVLEDDPRFNAGCGACLTRTKTIEMDAAVMLGDGSAGAVGAAPNIRNPITLARRIMEDGEHIFLVGEGALSFAAEVGIEPVPIQSLLTERAEKRFHETERFTRKGRTRKRTGWPADTVGAIALDKTGDLAVATSTGGMVFKRPGRVGDSPILGAGTWADERWGAAAATGEGEAIMRTLTAREAVDQLRAGADPMIAARESIDILQSRADGHGGVILLGADGRYGMAHNTSVMSWAAVRNGRTNSGIKA